MAVPSQLWMHDGISEREVAHYWPNGQWDDRAWEDCTYDSAVMYYRASFDPSVPSTHYEAERLRQASGEDPLGGTNPFDVRRGIASRYKKVAPQPITGWSTLRLVLAPGYNGIISGSMAAFPYGHRLRRPQPGFAGMHAIHGAKVDNQPRYWGTNPLFAEDHDGEWWTEDEVRRFVQAGGNVYHLISKTLPKPIIVAPKPTVETVRVSGSFWRYYITRKRTASGLLLPGYDVRREAKKTTGFAAKLGITRIGMTHWPEPDGPQRRFAKVVDSGSAYNGWWLDVLDAPNVVIVK